MPRISSSHPFAKVRAIHFERSTADDLDWGAEAQFLTDWIYDQLDEPRNSRRALAALKAIETAPHREPFYELVVRALDSVWASVRLEALRLLQSWPSGGERFHSGPDNQWFPTLDEFFLLDGLIRRDESWMVRQEALRALATATTIVNDSTLMRARAAAFTDPHWRVRHALIEIFQELYGAGKTNCGPWDNQLAGLRAGEELSDAALWIAQGFREYFCNVNGLAEPPSPLDENLHDRCREPESHWDDDPSVLAAYLDRCERGEAIDWPKFVTHYLGHADSRVTRAALRHLIYCDEQQWIDCLVVLDDPRHPAAELLSQYAIDQPTELAAAEHILLRREGTTIRPGLSGYHGPSAGQVSWALQRLTLLDEPLDVIRPWLPLAVHDEHTSPMRLAFTPAAVELASQLGDLIAEEEFEGDMSHLHEALILLAGSASLQERRAALQAIAQAPDGLSEEQREDLYHGNGKSSYASEQVLAVKVLMRGPTWKSFEAAMDEWSKSTSWQVRRQLAAEANARQSKSNEPSPPLTSVLQKLQEDSNSLVRAAAVTKQKAEQLLEQPELETSWAVLEAAARAARCNLDTIEPDPPETPATPSRPTHINCQPVDRGERIAFPLDEPTPVSRIGISGHYGLPTDGYAKAAEEGVNLFFWEPGYSGMTAFSQGIDANIRNQLHFIGGTFKADSKGIRDDVHRMLKHLKLERVSLFLLFWTRGWSRMTDEVLEELQRIEESGDVARASISTHNRQLACQAMRGEVELSHQRRWNPIMVRYSAAHRGAETEVLPLAADTKTSVISFNNTCYGRLLQPVVGVNETPAISAVDCYRFALSHPAVAVSLSAPANFAQLNENLTALHDPALPDDRREILLQHGEKVYQQDRRFHDCVRSR